MRTKGSPKAFEERRFRAIELLEKGHQPVVVARMVGVDRRSVRLWNQQYREGGAEALRAKPVPGAPTKLEDEQVLDLQLALFSGAEAHGFPTNMWTIPMVTKLIEKLHGVTYSEGHVWKLMTSWGWSAQKPEKQSNRRDDGAILEWKHVDWERIKKRAG